MAITSNIMNQAQQISPEARQLNNERKRIDSYIRSYQRNPKNWSDTMVQQLELMATQYNIPFKREVEDASALWNMAGTAGGAIDAAMFGIPGAIFGKPYEDESNRMAANIGRVGGAAASIIPAIFAAPFTKGASLAAAARGLNTAVKGAKGIKGAMDVAKAAGNLGVTAASKALPGQAARYAMQTGARTLAPYGASRGWQWAKNVQKSVDRGATADVLKKAKSAIRNTDDLGAVLKGSNLNKKQISSLANVIKNKYGKNSKVAKNYIEQLGKAKVKGGNLENVTSSQLVKMANSLNKNWNVSTANVQKLLTKAGVKGNSAADAAFITTKLREANISKLDEKAVALIIKLANKPSAAAKVGLGDLDKWGGLMALGSGAGAVSSLTDWTPSREELEAQEDPYNPSNV